jgi:hypothetical protein
VGLVGETEVSGKPGPVRCLISRCPGADILEPTTDDDPLRHSSDLVAEEPLQLADAHAASSATPLVGRMSLIVETARRQVRLQYPGLARLARHWHG